MLINTNTENEYESAVDTRVLSFIDKVAVNGANSVEPIDIAVINQVHADRLKELTEIDYNGYSVMLTGDAVSHISNRHGANGAADNSMADPKDLARIGWVANNFDNAKFTGNTAWNYRNRDNTPANVIMLQKRINGNYFVAEAVPDTNRKSIYIVTAYINKA